MDKYYRLMRGFNWWPDEQPSDEIKEACWHKMEECGFVVDTVLSHTCRLYYERWYCGHWHISKRVDKLHFLFHDFEIAEE